MTGPVPRNDLLAVRGLRKTFGGIVAVADATFAVPSGSITGLIGPNGAGKTTTFDLVAGAVVPDAGTVAIDGTDVTGRPSHQVVAKGLVRTFQVPRTFERMTVWENLMFAGEDHPGERFWRGFWRTGASRRREREIAVRVDEVLDFLELGQVADLPAGSLSGGQRKLLELGRALMPRPRMLLLDEPFAGVAPALTVKLVDRLRRLRDDGTTLLIVEHDLDTVLRLVDHLVVMHLGSVLVSGEPAVVRADERVLEAYLGGARV